MSGDTTLLIRRHRRLIVSVRMGLLALAVLLYLIPDDQTEPVGALVLLAAVAVVASAPMPTRSWTKWTPVAESVLAASIISGVQPVPEPLLPYLLAPALAGGLMSGFVTGVTAPGLAALVLLASPYVAGDRPSASDYADMTVAIIAPWVLLAAAVGLLGGWIRRLQTEREPENAAYAAAYRLLSQLRLVSRQLSGGLDPVTLAQGLLQQLERTMPFERGAVYVRAPAQRLVPIAFHGADRLDWPVDGQLFEEAWAGAEPVHQDTQLTAGAQGHAAVVPLQIGMRTFGLVAVERKDPFTANQLQAAIDVLEEQALRLETALLFSEVRTLATAEERRRLAREIHDGIAQELASLGYVVDDLASRARFLPDLQQDLKSLRGELTRVITELRLSIFDLRSEVHSTTGLGTALSDYVRQVGAGSNLTVHLVLDETPMRLPVDAEAELLRIAQEAITNARKHANAQNLWVTCSVDPPRATVRVEDDGGGLGAPRDDSFGLEVMRERAERIGAQLTVRNRDAGGTIVAVSLGAARVAG